MCHHTFIASRDFLDVTPFLEGFPPLPPHVRLFSPTQQFYSHFQISAFIFVFSLLLDLNFG